MDSRGKTILTCFKLLKTGQLFFLFIQKYCNYFQSSLKKNLEVILTSTQEVCELFDFDLKDHSIAAQRKSRILSISPVWKY